MPVFPQNAGARFLDALCDLSLSLFIRVINMVSLIFTTVVGLFSVPVFGQRAPPTATVKNGTYVGLHSDTYDQDLFLGIPYAQPPLGDLRLRLAQPLNETWSEERNATAYSPECVGYGGDQVGYDVSEDCLTINVVRPAGVADQSLPVALWIHGGGYVMGGSADRRYNLSFIVESSVNLSKPVIGVSINYRLSAWGFLMSEEVRAAGVTNLGMRDQRLALQWVQENIAAFGGDPTKVTIWGESAGAGSVGIHVTAYGGRDDKLFRAAISESGSPLLLGSPAFGVSQAVYNSITQAAGCSNSTDSLSCLRTSSFETLNNAFNVTPSYALFPQADGDLIQGSQYDQLISGQFVKVPYLIGANSDEGGSFGTRGVNTNSDFRRVIAASGVSDNATINTIEAVYPDIPSLGIPATLTVRPSTTVGTQFKRAAAYAGDFNFIAGRRLTNIQWSKFNVSSYGYRFNTIPNGYNIGIPNVGHFAEVSFVFRNWDGLGYSYPPFGGEITTPAYFDLSTLMSNAWISFVHDLDPNGHGIEGIAEWPVYNDGAGGYGKDFVFDANVTGLAYAEQDNFRGEAIGYLNSVWGTAFGL